MIALTGSTGFVGTRLLRNLIANGEQVVLLSRQSTDADRKDTQGTACQVRHWDAASGERPPLQGVRTIVHLAAYLPKNYNDPAEAEACLRINTLGSLRLLQACEEHGVEHAILCSSGNVYKRSALPVDERALTYPDGHGSFYLGSKLLGEIWASHFSSRGVNTMVLRPSAIYGPGMKGGIVRTLISRLSCGQSVTLQNQGRFSSDLVYVDDVVEACLSGIKLQTTGIYNIGSGTVTSIAELAGHISNALGINGKDLIQLEPADNSGIGFSALAIDRMKSILLVTPTSIADGVRRMIKEEAE